MKKIIIEKYQDLLKIDKNEKEFLISFKISNTSKRKKVIDFLNGLTYKKGSIKKVDKDNFIIIC